jgi:hypothetical protein
MPQTLFRVVVRHNMVTEIRQLTDESEDNRSTIDPLAISTLLASNNLRNGCLDGEYDLPDFETARHFAALCIGFQKNLCEKSLEAVAEAGMDGATSWRNRYVPETGRRVR